jgi:hypothetical protein
MNNAEILMNNSKILNDGGFISAYAIFMFLFPFTLFYYIFVWYDLDFKSFNLFFILFFFIIFIILLVSNIINIRDKKNKITYSLLISFFTFLIPISMSVYIYFTKNLPNLPFKDFFRKPREIFNFLNILPSRILSFSWIPLGSFLNYIFSNGRIIDIIMYTITIIILYLNLITSNSIDYHDAIIGSKNFLNFFIGLFVFVIFLYFIIPKFVSLINLFIISYFSGKLSSIGFNITKNYDGFLEGLDSVQDKFKQNYVDINNKDVNKDKEKSFFTNFFDYLKSIYNYISSSVIGSIYIIFDILNGFFENITKEVSSEELQPTLIKYGALYSFIFVILVILYLAAFDTDALTGKAYVYAFTIIIPLVLLFSYVIPFNNQKTSLTKLLTFAFGIVLFIGILYSYASLSNTAFTYISYAINLLIILIILFALAIFFYIFGNYLKTLNNFTGFLVYFIFYIPCLIIDFFKYIMNEFRMTSLVIYLLFVFEIIFILLYVYSSKIINFFITKTSKSIILLEKSAFLDIKTNIGNSYKLRMTSPINKENEKYIYRKNYAISMWVYLNSQPPNNKSYSKETEIFNYGDGKPRITYLNDTTIDNGKDKYIFYFTNNSNNSYSLTLPSQKWNNIVFNYYSDKVDLFINGNLERTYTFNENMPIYLATDVITIGSQDGLDGAICNVNYYSEPLTKSQITTAYNLLMTKNPPTLVV